MGLQFSVNHVNWLAHILQPTGTTPRLNASEGEEETLREFIQRLSSDFYSSREESLRLREVLSRIPLHDRLDQDVLAPIREYFSDVPWVALLIPSGEDPKADELLTDSMFLRELINVRPADPGLILQLDKTPESRLALQDVFPAFRVALAEFTRWPGALAWTPKGDSAFFELTKSVDTIKERLRWLFSHLPEQHEDLSVLKEDFIRTVSTDDSVTSQLRILHLSDLHLGCRLARLRMARIYGLISSVVSELGDDGPIIPVITGDLINTPREENVGDFRSFITFLNALKVETPVAVLGNHDVRKDGWLMSMFRQAVTIHSAKIRWGPVVWVDDHRVGFACFNSVNGGKLDRGRIGEEELSNVGNALDQERSKARTYSIVAVLHHHPIPVDRPSWYKNTWYEDFFGERFKVTEKLEDADRFLRWIKDRSVPLVLHGHKHIPRFDQYGDTAIVGCGSTVGKVAHKVQDRTYMSLNIITIDQVKKRLGCRLRAETVLGAGLESVASHELVIRTP